MRSPRLRESPNQNGIAGFKEQQFDGVTQVFDALEDADQVGKEHPFADVNAQCDVLYFPALLVTEFDKGRK